MRQEAQLKCLYDNAHGLGNKQKELETLMHLESCDLVAIPETRQDDPHHWSTTTEEPPATAPTSAPNSTYDAERGTGAKKQFKIMTGRTCGVSLQKCW